MTKATCSTPECGKVIRARGLCSTHYNQRDPKRHVPKLVACTACGAEVQRTGGGGKGYPRRPTCSERCRYYVQWGRWPKTKELVGPLPWVEVSRPAWSGHTIPSPRRVFINGACAWCGDTFTVSCPIGGSAGRYCTRRCAVQAGRSRSGGRFKPSQVLRQMIYRRDGWVCQLCFEPVDRDADPLSDWAASLDHIECQSWSLIPDHSASNLRLAHRWCNAVRGDESWFTAADLAV